MRSAHLHSSVGAKFDDHASIAPDAASRCRAPSTGPTRKRCAARIRLTPDGPTTGTFEPRLTRHVLRQHQPHASWPQVMLDRPRPERTLERVVRRSEFLNKRLDARRGRSQRIAGEQTRNASGSHMETAPLSSISESPNPPRDR